MAKSMFRMSGVPDHALMATRERVLALAGASVTVLSVVGLCVYFGAVGLDQADKLSSVIGAVLGLIGLALALYGALAERANRGAAAPPAAPTAPGRASAPEPTAPAPAAASTGPEAGGVHLSAEVSGNGRAYLAARDQHFGHDEPTT
jgi:hypothetical protein